MNATTTQLLVQVSPVVEAIQALRRVADGGEPLSDTDVSQCAWVGLRQHAGRPDAWMVRTRLPGGAVDAAQLRVLARIAQEAGPGYVDLTARQELQCTGIAVSRAASVIALLQEAGLSTIGTVAPTIRNIAGCPVAGCRQGAGAETDAIVQRLHRAYLDGELPWDLPAPVRLGVACAGESCVPNTLQDLWLNAGRHAEDAALELQFRSWPTGVSSGPWQRVLVEPDDVVEVVRHVLLCWQDAARGGRPSDQPSDPPQEMRPPEATPEDIRQQLEERLGRHVQAAGQAEPDQAVPYADLVGVHAQAQAGHYAIGVPVLVGRVTSDQLKAIADLSVRYTQGRGARLTCRQNLVLGDVPEDKVEPVLTGLVKAGLSINAAAVRRGVVVCAGFGQCPSAVTETKARARQVVDYLERHIVLERPLRIEIAGCQGACVRSGHAELELVGTKATVDGQVVDAFTLVVRGRAARQGTVLGVISHQIPATLLAKRLEQLFGAYGRRRRREEGFLDWCARMGTERLGAWLVDERQHPLAQEDAAQPDVPSVAA